MVSEPDEVTREILETAAELTGERVIVFLKDNSSLKGILEGIAGSELKMKVDGSASPIAVDVRHVTTITGD